MNESNYQRQPGPPCALLVETVPDELYEIEGSIPTHEVLLSLVERAKRELAIAAMYWTLLPGTAANDEEGLEAAQLGALSLGRPAPLAERWSERRLAVSASGSCRAPDSEGADQPRLSSWRRGFQKLSRCARQR